MKGAAFHTTDLLSKRATSTEDLPCCLVSEAFVYSHDVFEEQDKKPAADLKRSATETDTAPAARQAFGEPAIRASGRGVSRR